MSVLFLTPPDHYLHAFSHLCCTDVGFVSFRYIFFCSLSFPFHLISELLSEAVFDMYIVYTPKMIETIELLRGGNLRESWVLSDLAVALSRVEGSTISHV